MTIIETALTFIIILSILVVVHEWGHFIVARLFGIRVDEFSIGFGPRAIRLGQRGDTEYNIRWVPLGGYVKIAGMDADEEPFLVARDKITGRDKPGDLPLVAENTRDLAETDEQRRQDSEDGFYTKPVWQRSLVIFAGPFMSFALGYLVFCAMGFTIGWPRVVDTVGAVLKGSEAQRIGMQPGDEITQIDHQPVALSFVQTDRLIQKIRNSPGKAVLLTIVRNGQTITLTGVPKPTKLDGRMVGLLGFETFPEPETSLPRQRESVADSVHTGTLMTGLWFKTIWHLVSHHQIREIRSSAGGPIMIAQYTAHAVKRGVWDITDELAELSLSLAIFNLLPIPILDGGHLLEFLVEKVRSGRRMTPAQKQNFMLAGLAVIGVLFVLIMFNDILRTIHHQLPQ